MKEIEIKLPITAEEYTKIFKRYACEQIRGWDELCTLDKYFDTKGKFICSLDNALFVEIEVVSDNEVNALVEITQELLYLGLEARFGIREA